ncbi:hypothetical protein BaRGS_00036515 [Batillaria attramentaria]|uniref:Uncharacterized protein n=1 Tax=Batillaria attramentaria TaxID=370345 RepID=A0ABD0JBE0_9CAEN
MDSSEGPPAYTAGSGEQPNPPSYTDVERNSGPPPSYDSLFGKVRAVRNESSGNVDFVKKVIFLILGTIGFTIFLGAKYLDDCPAERYIPIYLVVAGCFGVVRNLFTIGRRCCQKKENEEEEQKAKVNPIESVIDCFMFAWFIAGNVWIYRTKGDFSTDPTAENFCDPTLYWFAFWITTAVYIIMGCCCCCICFCGILAACLSGGSS